MMKINIKFIEKNKLFHLIILFFKNIKKNQLNYEKNK
jgi:hypothetical protein